MSNKQARVFAVIPSRYASSRLPGKPLREIGGLSLIERVWRQAQGSKLIGHLAVATDDQRIADEVKRFGGEVVMTSAELSTGSERVREAARILGRELSEQGNAAALEDFPENVWDCVVNVQGDMPFISGEVIDGTIQVLLENKDRFAMTTLAVPISNEEIFSSSSDVKVVVGAGQQALYFSRAPIPHSRDGVRLKGGFFGYKHIGLYVFRPSTLSVYAGADRSQLEEVEMLEQLRALERGMSIGVFIGAEELSRDFVEVDTAADLEQANEIARRLEKS